MDMSKENKHNTESTQFLIDHSFVHWVRDEFKVEARGVALNNISFDKETYERSFQASIMEILTAKKELPF